MDMIVFIERLDLSLVRQSTKRCREDDSIMILDENRSIWLRFVGAVAETFATKKLLPFHNVTPLRNKFIANKVRCLHGDGRQTRGDARRSFFVTSFELALARSLNCYQLRCVSLLQGPFLCRVPITFAAYLNRRQRLKKSVRGLNGNDGQLRLGRNHLAVNFDVSTSGFAVLLLA
ncbi:hypothetical protein BH09PSE3_BH09PSE3_23710 [soil metagenome]